MVSEIISHDASQRFTAKGYKVSVYPRKKPKKNSLRYRRYKKRLSHWVEMRTQAVRLIDRALSQGELIRKVFGNGKLKSKSSRNAEEKAKTNFRTAREKLKKTRNVVLDYSGISENIGLGGYVTFTNQKLFMVIEKLGTILTDEVLTTVHEAMHLASDDIGDDIGYAGSSGKEFETASIKEKLQNADHYAQVVSHMTQKGDRKPLPFTPQAEQQQFTTKWDTEDSEELRYAISSEARELWDASVDGFLALYKYKRKKTEYLKSLTLRNLSKLLNMTLHRPGVKHSRIYNLDLSLAESTVKRMSNFHGEMSEFSESTDKSDTKLIKKKAPKGFKNTKKEDQEKFAFKTILNFAGNSSELKPADLLPTKEKHLGGLRNRVWGDGRSVWK